MSGIHHILAQDIAKTLAEATDRGLVGWQRQGNELFSTQIANLTVMVGRALADNSTPYSVSVFSDKNVRLERIDSSDAATKSVVEQLFGKAVQFVSDANKAGAGITQPAQTALEAIKSALQK